jgi:hypothetical protein
LRGSRRRAASRCSAARSSSPARRYKDTRLRCGPGCRCSAT